MFNLDPGKLIVIAVVAIILLGPDKLPQVAKQVGAAWRSFTEFRHRMEAEVRSSMPDLPPTSEIARLARSPSALLHHLSSMSEDSEEGKEPAAGEASPTASGQGGALAEASGPDGTPGASSNGAGAGASAIAGVGANGDGPRGAGEVAAADPSVESAGTVSPEPTAPRSSETIVQGDPNLN